MAKLTDFPPGEVAVALQSIVNLAKMKFGGHAGYLAIEVTIEQARMLWAASKHLEFISDWGVGIERRRYAPDECRAYIDDLVKYARSCSRKSFDYEELMVLDDAATHIDRLAMMQAEKSTPKRWNGGKRK